MRVLTLYAPGLPFHLNQPAPTPAAQAIGAKVIQIRPLPVDGIFGEVVCKSDSYEDLIIVHVVDFGSSEPAFTETRMTQAEYNDELARSLELVSANGDEDGEDEDTNEGAVTVPPVAPPAPLPRA